jgi:hypothetical protein
VLWRHLIVDGKARKLPISPHTLRHASSTNPSTWATFNQAVDKLRKNEEMEGLGFVLSEDDPFCFIDLDYSDDVQILKRHLHFANNINTYSEISPSGKGLHLICKGAVPRGAKRDGTEIYSTARFMTMTGNTYRNLPISECQEAIDYIYQTILVPKNNNNSGIFINEEQKYTDEKIFEFASHAKNSEKFLKLWQGDLLDYPTFSEADLALVNIIAFYSKNRDQIKRIFRGSELGKREKYKKEYHLNRMINMSFDKNVKILDFELLNYRKYEAEIESIEVLETGEDILICEDLKEIEVSNEDLDRNRKEVNEIFTFPEGLIGEIARHIFDNSPKPIEQISILTAIGLLAGIAGRAYNINSAGLNQYIALVTGPGRGKEIIASSIQSILETVANHIPAAKNFIGPIFGSAQGIISHLSKHSNCFISVMGEFGKTYKKMMQEKDSEAGIQRVLLDLYNKSGNNNYLSSVSYSKSENNLKGVKSPCVSIIGETSQEIFYSSITEMSLSDGWLTRFLIVDYVGPVKKARQNLKLSDLPTDLLEKLCRLCANCDFLNKSDKVIDVRQDSEGASILDEFENFAVAKANATESENFANIWVRAHFKALKLAALLAVGRNIYEPVINKADAIWSTSLVYNECNALYSKFKYGNQIVIANSNQEAVRVSRIKEIAEDYIKNGCPPGYKISTPVYQGRSQSIIPKKLLTMKVAKIGVFKSHPYGATKALNLTIEVCIEMGFLTKISQIQTEKMFGSEMECYYYQD